MKMTKIVIQAHISPYVMPKVCAKSLLPWITSLQSLSEKFLTFTIVSFTITLLYHLSFLFTGCKDSSFFRIMVILESNLYEILVL